MGHPLPLPPLADTVVPPATTTGMAAAKIAMEDLEVPLLLLLLSQDMDRADTEGNYFSVPLFQHEDKHADCLTG